MIFSWETPVAVTEESQQVKNGSVQSIIMNTGEIKLFLSFNFAFKRKSVDVGSSTYAGTTGVAPKTQDGWPCVSTSQGLDT